MNVLEEITRHQLNRMRDDAGPRLLVIACPRRFNKTRTVAKLRAEAAEIGVVLLDEFFDERAEREAREGSKRVLVLSTPHGHNWVEQATARGYVVLDDSLDADALEEFKWKLVSKRDARECISECSSRGCTAMAGRHLDD